MSYSFSTLQAAPKKRKKHTYKNELFVILVFSCDTWDETETWDWGFLVACVNVRKLNYSEDKQEVKCKLNLQHWKMRPTEKSQKTEMHFVTRPFNRQFMTTHKRLDQKSTFFFSETQLGQIHQHVSIRHFHGVSVQEYRDFATVAQDGTFFNRLKYPLHLVCFLFCFPLLRRHRIHYLSQRIR